MSGTMIPNSFQTPNIYIDVFAALLTPQESLVLSYTARRVYGFNDGRTDDAISIRQYVSGKKVRGNRVDLGLNMSINTVKKALDGLIRYGLIVETVESSPSECKAARYAPQRDITKIDIDGLLERSQSKDITPQDIANIIQEYTPPGSKFDPGQNLTAPEVAEPGSKFDPPRIKNCNAIETQYRNSDHDPSDGAVAPAATDDAIAQETLPAMPDIEPVPASGSENKSVAAAAKPKRTRGRAAPKVAPPAEAEAGKEKKPRSEAQRARDVLFGHPAVQVWAEITEADPKKLTTAALRTITDAIAPDEESLKTWRTVVKRWTASDYNVRNVQGLVQWYHQERVLPGLAGTVPRHRNGNGNGQSNGNGNGQPQKLSNLPIYLLDIDPTARLYWVQRFDRAGQRGDVVAQSEMLEDARRYEETGTIPHYLEGVA